MSYILEKWAPLTVYGDAQELMMLPPYDATSTTGPGGVPTQYVPTVAGGMFDGLGGADAHVLSQVIRHAGTFVSTIPADLDARYQAIAGALGKAGRLWRKWIGAEVRHWCYARFTSLEGERSQGQLAYQPIVMEFTRTSPWFAELASTQQVVLGVTPYSFVVTRDTASNAPVFDAIITVTAQGVGITDLVIENTTNGSYIRFTGATIAVGKSLVIDCGTGTVKNDGANAIAYFSLGAGHAIPDWLRLEAGGSVNTIRVTRTGGGSNSTIRFDWYEAWK